MTWHSKETLYSRYLNWLIQLDLNQTNNRYCYLLSYHCDWKLQSSINLILISSRQRQRKEESLYGGSECIGPETETGDCSWLPECPSMIESVKIIMEMILYIILLVDGGWANWGSWSTVGICTKECGSGQQFYQRTRTCSNPRYNQYLH